MIWTVAADCFIGLWELSGHSDVLSDCPKEEEFLNGVQILVGRPSKNDEDM